MTKEQELKKWQKIWDKGLEKAKLTDKKENDYKIQTSINVPLEHTDLISSKEWQEVLEKALLSPTPSEAFEYWIKQGWLQHAIPEIVNLYNVPQTEKYHPEIDSGIHAMMVIDMSAANNFSLRTRYFALFHDFGKAITSPDILPAHHGHEKAGVPLVKKRLESLDNLSLENKKEILFFTQYHGIFHDIKKLKITKIINFIEQYQFDKNISFAKDVCDGLCSDSQGRKNYFHKPSENSYIFMNIMNSWKENEVNFEENLKNGWLDKVEKVKQKTGQNINKENTIPLKFQEIFKREYYSNVIKKVVASYYPNSIIENKNTVKGK